MAAQTIRRQVFAHCKKAGRDRDVSTNLVGLNM